MYRADYQYDTNHLGVRLWHVIKWFGPVQPTMWLDGKATLQTSCECKMPLGLVNNNKHKTNAE